MQDLLRKMITFNPKDRIIFQKLFKHKLFRDEVEENSSDIASILSKPVFLLVISDQIQLAQ